MQWVSKSFVKNHNNQKETSKIVEEQQTPKVKSWGEKMEDKNETLEEGEVGATPQVSSNNNNVQQLQGNKTRRIS